MRSKRNIPEEVIGNVLSWIPSHNVKKVIDRSNYLIGIFLRYYKLEDNEIHHIHTFRISDEDIKLILTNQNTKQIEILYLSLRSRSDFPYSLLESVLGLSKAKPEGETLKRTKVLSQNILLRSIDLVNVEVFKTLIDEYGVLPDTRHLPNAIRSNSYEIVDKVLPLYDPLIHIRGSLTLACRLGNARIVNLLLSKYYVSPCERNNGPIIEACKRGHHDIVKLLLTRNEVDPSVKDNMCLLEAVKYGHYSTVKELLIWKPDITKNGRKNKIIVPSRAIMCAAALDRVDIFEILFNDSRLIVNHGRLLIQACFGCNLYIIKLVLNKLSTLSHNNLRFVYGKIISRVCSSDHPNSYQIFKLIVENSSMFKVDPKKGVLEIYDDTLIIKACKKNNYKIIKYILDNNYFDLDPSINNNECLIIASRYGHTDILELLLNWSPKEGIKNNINPGDQNDEAIIWASINGHSKVVKLLLDWVPIPWEKKPLKGRKSFKVNPAARNYSALRWTSDEKCIELLQKIRGSPNDLTPTSHIFKCYYGRKRGNRKTDANCFPYVPGMLCCLCLVMLRVKKRSHSYVHDTESPSSRLPYLEWVHKDIPHHLNVVLKRDIYELTGHRELPYGDDRDSCFCDKKVKTLKEVVGEYFKALKSIGQ